jgi:hypothetical protein
MIRVKGKEKTFALTTLNEEGSVKKGQEVSPELKCRQ